MYLLSFDGDSFVSQSRFDAYAAVDYIGLTCVLNLKEDMKCIV